jgi:hypothetical protein
MPYDLCENNGVWVVMFVENGRYEKPWVAFFESNARNFSLARRPTGITKPRFKIGQQVKVHRMIVQYNDREVPKLLGFTGTVDEIEELPNGEFNYDVSGHYLNEYMLEPVAGRRRGVVKQSVGAVSRDVDLIADGIDYSDEEDEDT